MSYLRPLLIARVALVLALAGSPVDAHGDHRPGDRTPFDVHGGVSHDGAAPAGQDGHAGAVSTRRCGSKWRRRPRCNMRRAKRRPLQRRRAVPITTTGLRQPLGFAESRIHVRDHAGGPGLRVRPAPAVPVRQRRAARCRPLVRRRCKRAVLIRECTKRHGRSMRVRRESSANRVGSRVRHESTACRPHSAARAS
jgi:hypothetical protein